MVLVKSLRLVEVDIVLPVKMDDQLFDLGVDVLLLDAEVAGVGVSDEEVGGLASQTLKVQPANMVQ